MASVTSSNVKRPETKSHLKSNSTSKSTTSDPVEKDKSKKELVYIYFFFNYKKNTQKTFRFSTKGRFVKGPSPPPAIPQAVLGKRYLPGDVRYKQQQELLKTTGLPTSSAPVQKKPNLESLFGPSSNRKEYGESSKSIQRPNNSTLSR